MHRPASAWLLARPLQSMRGSQALLLVLDRPGVSYREDRLWHTQLRGYLERELLATRLMPLWLVSLDELGDKAHATLESIPAALFYDRTVT